MRPRHKAAEYPLIDHQAGQWRGRGFNEAAA